MSDAASRHAELQAQLDSLKVEPDPEAQTEGVSLRIDFGALPGAAERVFRAHLTPDGSLNIQRPEGAVHLAKTVYTQGSTPYTWNEGVPSSGNFRPPVARTKGRSARKDRFYSMPLHATLARVALDSAAPNALRPYFDKTADRLWKDFWKALGPHLHEPSLAVASRGGLDWFHYRALIERPDLRRIGERYPGITPRLRKIFPRKDPRDAVKELLGSSRTLTNRETGQHERYDYGREPGFLAWAESVPWSDSLLPVISLPGESKTARETGYPAWELMMRLSKEAEAGHLDPNQVRKLEGDDAWLLLHTVAMRGTYGGRILQAVLNDPAAIVPNLERHFPKESWGKRSAQRAAIAVREIERWCGYGFTAAYRSRQWSAKLGDPSIEFAAPHDRVRGFGRLCRETSKARARMERARRLDTRRYDESPDEFLLFAPVATVRKVVQHPDFTWEPKELAYLASDPRFRLDPEIRAGLIQRAEGKAVLEVLLADGRPDETRQLWERLARVDAERAADYLEKHGFDRRAAWQPGDLVPLFEQGGDITVRAMALRARLAEVMEQTAVTDAAEDTERARSPEHAAEGRPTAMPQMDLFGFAGRGPTNAPKARRRRV